MCWFNNKSPKHLPKATGPFMPGYTDVIVGYSKDGLLMRLYYPTDENNYDGEDNEVNSSKWRLWIPDASYLRGIANVLVVFPFILQIFLWWWKDYLKVPALFGEPIKSKKTFKPIILSHGLGGHRFLYTNVCNELASRGFLVLAVEHRDHSASNTYFYSSQKSAENDQRSIIDFHHVKLGKDHFSRRQEQVIFRAKECSKVVDFLIDVNNGKVPYNVLDDVPKYKNVAFKLKDLVGRIEMDSLVMIGHSFGGATTLLTLSQRKEIKLGILMDPWMFPIKEQNLAEEVKQPLLFVNTQTFHIKTNVEAMEKFLINDDRQMNTILHTTHENQTDSVIVSGYWMNWFMKKLDPVVALRINSSLILCFLNKYLNFPIDIKDCRDYLKAHHDLYQEGLTNPWA